MPSSDDSSTPIFITHIQLSSHINPNKQEIQESLSYLERAGEDLELFVLDLNFISEITQKLNFAKIKSDYSLKTDLKG